MKTTSTSVSFSLVTVKWTIKVTRPSFLGGYYPTLKLYGIPTFTLIVSLTQTG